MFIESDLVRVAKRENNNKRKYLVVNCLQAKHIPVEPHKTLGVFDELAGKVRDSFSGENLLLIGFAETATAIGSRLAVQLDSWYMQTTRENIKDVEYLYFSESHSHATEQKLVKDDLDKIIDSVDRIVFVEDEVTTGNTIMKIIDIIRHTYKTDIKFGVACILNGMNAESEERYSQQNIDMVYLVKTDHSKYESIAESYKEDGCYYTHNSEECNDNCKIEDIRDYADGRRLIKGSDYDTACEKLWKNIKEKGTFSDKESVLVIGTEEFMYPAIYVAFRLEETGALVKCHSTTRSPIAVSSEEVYPLHCRYELRSLYDVDRRTFIYDIGKYDKVVVITDATDTKKEAVADLVGSISAGGNSNIYLFRWCE